jgi:hypothetical protein
MHEPRRRLWGIDVIAAIYGLATVALVWLCFNGTPSGRTFGLILAPMALRATLVTIASRPAPSWSAALLRRFFLTLECGAFAPLFFSAWLSGEGARR